MSCLRQAALLGLAVLAFALAFLPRAGAQSVTLDVGGMPRSFEIHGAPPGSPPRALVIALHGLGQPIVDLRRDLGLDALAVRENFLVAYPSGIDARWNYGRQLNRAMPLVAGAEVDDVAFLSELIIHLVSRGDVDPKRVYLLGVSNGALMAYRTVCDMGGQLAAVAAFISGMSEFQKDECRGAPLPPLLVLAGSGDTFQLYDGGQTRLGRLVSVPDTVGFFRGRQGCTGVESEELPDLDPDDGTTVTVLRARGCRPGGDVVFYRINGGGHRVPTLAPHDTRPHPRFGRTNRDIDAGREAWDFFRRFKLP